MRCGSSIFCSLHTLFIGCLVENSEFRREQALMMLGRHSSNWRHRPICKTVEICWHDSSTRIAFHSIPKKAKFKAVWRSCQIFQLWRQEKSRSIYLMSAWKGDRGNYFKTSIPIHICCSISTPPQWILCATSLCKFPHSHPAPQNFPVGGVKECFNVISDISFG